MKNVDKMIDVAYEIDELIYDNFRLGKKIKNIFVSEYFFMTLANSVGTCFRCDVNTNVNKYRDFPVIIVQTDIKNFIDISTY